jgi:hypothetical protein
MATSDSTVAQRRAKWSKRPLDIDAEVAVMQGMTIGQLRERYADVYGEPSRSRHKMHLIRKIAWRMQALAEGDLSEWARRRAEELANDADIRVMPPKSQRVNIPTEGTAMSLLVARVEYDATESTVAVSFHDSGIKALARTKQGDAA